MRHEKIFLTEEKYNLQFSWVGSVYLVSRLPDQCRVTVRGVAGAKWPLVSVSPTCTGVVTLLWHSSTARSELSTRTYSLRQLLQQPSDYCCHRHSQSFTVLGEVPTKLTLSHF